jgi:hypothetical protein
MTLCIWYAGIGVSEEHTLSSFMLVRSEIIHAGGQTRHLEYLFIFCVGR